MNRNIDPLPNRLQILQININKSQKAHLDLINRALGRNWDLILIQEPHILIQEPHITHLGHIRTPNGFTSIFLQDQLARLENTVRSVIWVNSELSSNSWKALNIPGNNDLTAIQLYRHNTKLSIFNIYNDCTHSNTLTRLRRYMQEESPALGIGANSYTLWCGDFNRHHPLWNDETDNQIFTNQALREAVLVGMLADEGLEMDLPKGIPTLKHMVTNSYSHPDNVWCSLELTPFIIRCEVDSYLQPPCTDHFPIVTIVDLPQERLNPKLSYNFRMADWEAFREQLVANLENIPLPAVIDTKEGLQQAVLNLMEMIQNTVKESIQVSKPCPYSKRWWNGDLRKLRKELNKLSRTTMKQRAIPHHHCHGDRRKAAQEYGNAITEAKQKHWTDYLEEASAKDLWTAN